MPTIYGKELKVVARDTCTLCGLCIEHCPTAYLELKDGKVVGEKEGSWGCLTCGHCSAVCPVDAIHVESDMIGPDDILPFSKAKPPNDEELFRLLVSRRSIRKFLDKPVPREATEKIIEASQQSPSGLPPSRVKALILEGKEKVRSFAFDFLDEAGKSSWLFSKYGIWLMRPFMPAEEHRDMRELIVPLFQMLLKGRAHGKDYLFYDAPLAIIFAGTGDPIDAGIACTYAMLAAETLGLGSCMIGTVVPMLGRMSPAFKEKYKIPAGMKHGLAIIFGYPAVTFERGVRRRFAGVSFA